MSKFYYIHTEKPTDTSLDTKAYLTLARAKFAIGSAAFQVPDIVGIRYTIKMASSELGPFTVVARGVIKHDGRTASFREPARKIRRAKKTPKRYVAKRRTSRSPSALSTEARELLLYAENESSLYPKKKMILANLSKKIASGKYDHRLAPTLWAYWVEDAARSYGKEFLAPGEWAKVFPPKVRNEVAHALAKSEYEAIVSGEYR